MRAVWLEPSQPFLEERRRLGLDKFDEVWDGVLHMVPPASFLHGRSIHRLAVALEAIAERRGLIAVGDGVGLFESDTNYRVPDASIARPDQVSERGLDGAELVVEVLSPNDESRDKLPFYAKLCVREVWIVDPKTRQTEILALVRRKYIPARFVRGRARSPLLGITIEVTGGKLRLRDGDDIHEI
jgi:Uma2 family endonuclease